MDSIKLVIVTGMSGAGKTVATRSLEDLGYFCIDNMPPALFSKFWELVKESGTIKKIGLVVDLRSREFYDEIFSMIRELKSQDNIDAKILFLDASDEELVSRYKETRRVHPLEQEGGRLLDGVRKERKILEEIKNISNIVIDTTSLSTRQFSNKILENFKDSDQDNFYIEVMSFGFKYGLPIDADIVMDVRFLPNPFYVKELKPLTGMDKPVFDYVFNNEETKNFYSKFYDLLNLTLPGYQKEGKKSLTIAIGCTGGQHRSVSIANKLYKDLQSNYNVNIMHRDVEKSQKGGH